MSHLGDLEQIIGDTTHHMPGLGLVKEPKGEFLQVTEQFASHIGLHLYPKNMSPGNPYILADSLQYVDEEHKAKDDNHILQILVRDLHPEQLSGQGGKENRKD